MSIERAAVEAFLISYGEALTTGDLERIAASYGVPGLVVSDAGPLAYISSDEVRAAFAGAATQYREAGLSATHPTIERLELLSDRVAEADVRWDAVDASGDTKFRESLLYVIHDHGGTLQIVVAVQRLTT
jgi:hypothetical protein